mmetsp:Transcript_17412/g.43391  ORF Transcript_17412/g.43391 Transcript_17412/m.43391 type:complete len:85 (+) Transcript_17412:979-1233(+)
MQTRRTALEKLGESLRRWSSKKIEKWQEVPPSRQVKALPVPDDKQRKKRGGKRIRRMKERFALTEVQKQANRLAFGEKEVECVA